MINRRIRLLARVLFGRLFENDLFSSSTSASAGVTWLLAALATPGVMFSGSQFYYYAHSRTFAPAAQDRILFVSQAFHVGFAMAVAGLVTMLVWTSLTPDRRATPWFWARYRCDRESRHAHGCWLCCGSSRCSRRRSQFQQLSRLPS